MSRLYPERRNRGPWRKMTKPYTITTDGGIRIKHHNETDFEETEPTPEHVGWVLRGGVYVWGGRGNPRKKPKP